MDKPLEEQYPYLAEHLASRPAGHGYHTIEEFCLALAETSVPDEEIDEILLDMERGYREEAKTTEQVVKTGSLCAPKQQFVYDDSHNRARFITPKEDLAQGKESAHAERDHEKIAHEQIMRNSR